MQEISSRKTERISKFKKLHTKQDEIMNVENTKAQMRKGVLEYCILSILNGEDKYASEILDTLKDAKMLVVEGTIYPLLTRLKNAGLLNYRWEESTSGPPRKYYTLTETGKLFLKELDTTWDELRSATNLVTNNKNN
ncbi:transcriptional regulator, PadR family [Cellulophaga tyrosinoxydans]|jgi:PadR family transcriptional regulator, regulatory protein PadR|uniref:Transcriptional regulator, PadR family n=2 Tax=Cellulophaga tyrosinoxydans TaxID=504486 RepID=A0A1W2BQN0_9FLAO|nr:transcriptional regulator, PadR family [Cellulophaga tyrosinoxydans]